MVPAYASSLCYQLQLLPVLMLILFERFSGAHLTPIFSLQVGTAPTLFVASPLQDCLCVCESAESGSKVGPSR